LTPPFWNLPQVEEADTPTHPQARRLKVVPAAGLGLTGGTPSSGRVHHSRRGLPLRLPHVVGVLKYSLGAEAHPYGDVADAVGGAP
jgi:hypothetical protein